VLQHSYLDEFAFERGWRELAVHFFDGLPQVERERILGTMRQVSPEAWAGLIQECARNAKVPEQTVAQREEALGLPLND
jgi:hypothetical protein